MSVLVSIHDVTPAWNEEVELALERCAEVGCRPALLVVPDHHGMWPLGDHPAFVRRLHVLQDEGHPILLHGLTHKQVPGAKRGAWGWLAQNVVSAGEAEFSDLDAQAANERIERGERVLVDLGLRIDGFVAPAWSMGTGLVEVLGKRGYRFTESHMRIFDPVAKRSRPSLVLNYASRTTDRLVSSVAFCRLAAPARGLLPTRLAIHPADMRLRLLRNELDRMLGLMSKEFVRTPSELLAS